MQHRVLDGGRCAGDAVAPADHHRCVAHGGHHFLAQHRVSDQHRTFVDRHAAARKPGSGNVVGPVDRSDGDAGEIGGDDGGWMQMCNRPMSWIGQHRLDVDGEFVGDPIPVQFSGSGCAAVESDEPDIRGPGERHAAVGVAAASEQQSLVVHPQTQMAQDAVDQPACGRDPAGLCHQRALLVQSARS